MHHGMGGMCPMCGSMEHHMGGHGMKGMKGMFMMMPWKMMMHKEELGISDDQIAKMRDIHVNMLKKKVQLKSQIKLDKIDLKSMIMQEQVNMQEVEQKVRDMMKLKGDVKLTWIQAMQDMKNTLTPDQRKNIKMMIMSMCKEGGMPGGDPMEEEEEEESESEE